MPGYKSNVSLPKRGQRTATNKKNKKKKKK